MKKTGIILLAVGIVMLAAAILTAMSTGGPLATVLITGSVIVNSAAVMMITTRR